MSVAVGIFCKSEDEIERKVERAIDALDRAFMAGNLTQQQYDDAVGVVDRWSKDQYAFIKAAR